MAEIQSLIARAYCVSDETEAKAFNSKVLNGKLLAAVRGVFGQVMGGVIYPGEANSDTG